MTEQTQAETDPYLDHIPLQVQEDYVLIGRSVAALDAEIAALQSQRRVLVDERQAIFDMTATDATDDATIVALRKTGAVADQRLLDEVRAISRLLWDVIEFTGAEGSETYPGPYVSLLEHRDRPLSSVDPADLAAALVEFARRFCPNPPLDGYGEHHVYADVMTDIDSLTIRYTPDGSSARLSVAFSGHEEMTGTLVEMCAAAIDRTRRANARGGDD